MLTILSNLSFENVIENVILLTRLLNLSVIYLCTKLMFVYALSSLAQQGLYFFCRHTWSMGNLKSLTRCNSRKPFGFIWNLNIICITRLPLIISMKGCTMQTPDTAIAELTHAQQSIKCFAVCMRKSLSFRLCISGTIVNSHAHSKAVYEVIE